MKTKLRPAALSLSINPMRPMFGMPRFVHDTAGDGGGSAGAGGAGAGGAGQGGQGSQVGDGGQGGGQGGAPGMIQMTQERFDQLMLDRVAQERRQWEGRVSALDAEIQKLKGGGQGGQGSPGGQGGGQGGTGDKTYTQADLQQLLSQKDEEYQIKLKEAKDREAALLEKERSAAIISAAAAAKAVDPQDVALLVGRFVSHDDRGDIVVLNDKGMPRLNGNGDPMTVDEFVKQYVDSKPHLKQAANAGGAGSGTKPGGASQQQQAQRPKSVREAARIFGQTMTN